MVPALDTALREKSADKATVLTMRMLRTELDSVRAEVAALKEPMACTHPRACWQATKPDSVDAVVGYRCVACEDKRLAVAAALWEAILLMKTHVCVASTGEQFGIVFKFAENEILKLADTQALDAHDADTRDRALEEADSAFGCAYREEMDSSKDRDLATLAGLKAIRALKREKRGGE